MHAELSLTVLVSHRTPGKAPFRRVGLDYRLHIFCMPSPQPHVAHALDPDLRPNQRAVLYFDSSVSHLCTYSITRLLHVLLVQHA